MRNWDCATEGPNKVEWDAEQRDVQTDLGLCSSAWKNDIIHVITTVKHLKVN